MRTVVAAGWVALGLFFPGAMARGADPDEAAIRDEIRPFLDAHCVKCHGPAKKKGGVDLAGGADLASIRKGRKSWRGVIEQVETLEMPPEGEPAPAPERRDRVVALLKKAVASFDCDDPSSIDPGPPPARRLTRDEYDRTVRDLLGVPIRSAEAVGMPADGSGSGASGFSNLAEALILPPVLMEKYFAAADKALELAFERPANREALDRLLVARPGPGLADREAARRVIARFLRLAYRRPVADAEVDRYLALFDRSLAKGATFEDSARLMVKAALVSPHFLFRIETDQPSKGAKASYRVGDHELAVRLSYFLWSSMPDAALSATWPIAGQALRPVRARGSGPADAGRPQGEGPDRGLRRAVAPDRQAGRRPSQHRVLPRPSTPRLRQSLRDETVRLLRQAPRGRSERPGPPRTPTTPISMPTWRSHYGDPGRRMGPTLRRVALPGRVSSGGPPGDGERPGDDLAHLPDKPDPPGQIHPGSRLRHAPPLSRPPAPASCPEEVQPRKGEVAERPSVSRWHSTPARPSAPACHAKIDPLGYGLENFDAVGRWRHRGRRPAARRDGQAPGGPSPSTGQTSSRRSSCAPASDDFERNLIERTARLCLGPRGPGRR